MRARLAWAALLTLAAALPVAGETRSNAWSEVGGPTAGPALAIGSTGNGCLSGAAPLPADGVGYAVIRLSRRRYFGHPELIAFIEDLGRRARAAGLPPFLVGDMAQPRGGPLPFGHASHQTGIDVDIWFNLDAKVPRDPEAREEPDLPSMLKPGGEAVDPARFGPRQVRLLQLAAADPRVDRIFVNPTIKLALCRGFAGATETGDGWLRRLRPWWGHDDHFHIRLRCPENAPACEPQVPVPDGTGCDPALEDWTHHQTPPKPGKPAPPPEMSAACRAVLAAH